MTTAVTPFATALWTGEDIARVTGGALSAPFAATAVTFDSREVEAGSLFIAMPGTAHDGHDFIDAAHAAGASGFVVERPIPYPHVLVADVPAALDALGRAARARTPATITGVTGSVGKTGTKEALRRALQGSAPGHVHASVKSYNNHTGVPLSLARMPADSRFAIFEMGMNHAGEIATLTRMVKPHIAVITWVAPAHIAHFASLADIARAKAEIVEGVEPGGTLIWPFDNDQAPILAMAARERRLHSLGFGLGAGADVRATNVEVGPDGSRFTADVAGVPLRCRIGMAGHHWVGNALAVLAAVRAAGGDLQRAADALASFTDLPGRGARIDIAVANGRATLIDESYNANPTSMAAALAVLGGIKTGRRLAILGAMRELGRESDARHAALAGPIAEAGVSELALVGAEMAALAVPGAAHLPDWQAALSWAKETVRAGDTLLVKGSNSVRLDRLVERLKEGP